MKVKLTATLFIDPAETALIDQIKTFLVNNKAKFLKIDSHETSSIEVEKCRHDEIPPSPCESVFKWEKA